ncbi:MAG: trigger factor [Aliidongia sp.]
MQITETSTEGLKREFKIVVAAGDIEQRLQDRLVEIGKTVKLPGFRPGKVPTAVLKQRYGQSVMGEVLEDTVNQTSGEALRERNLRPALQPKITIGSFEPGQDLTYDMALEILPDVTAPDVSLVELERLTPEISDEELNEALERLAERYRKTETVTDGSAAAMGDVVVMDFAGSIDGVEFPGGKGENHELELGSGRFIPGFEEQLVGAKTGDHVTVKVDFPADYAAAHLAGKTASFECDIKEVKRKLPPVIDDSLADEVGMENIEALRTAIREQMSADYARVARQKMKRDLLDKLSEEHVFDVPPGMVEIEFESIWSQFEAERKRAQEAGTYEPEEGKTDDDYKAEYRGYRRSARPARAPACGNRQEQQHTGSSGRGERAIMAQARQYPGQEKAVIDYYKANPDAVNALHAPLYEDKVVDFIFGMAKVTDKPVPAKELPALAGLDDEEEAVA